MAADTLHNATSGTAFSLETNANTWTLDHNTLIANSTTVAHSTTMVSASAGEWEYFTVSIGADKTLIVDIDFDSPFGSAAETYIEILGTDGATVVASNEPGPEWNGETLGLDLSASYTPAAAGTYYIRVKADYAGA